MSAKHKACQHIFFRSCHTIALNKLTLVRLLLSLLLLLLGGRSLLSSSGTASSSSTGSRSGGSTTRADVQEHVLEVLALEGLGEESAPDGLDVGDLGGGDERLELVGLEGGECVSLEPLLGVYVSWKVSCDNLLVRREKDIR